MIEKENVGKGFRRVARYSDCEKYRYTLKINWDDNKDKIVFLGLNPSTATEMKNDPTVTRMINFAKSWGYGSLSVCNIFAFRTTLPSKLKKSKDPVGEENDKWILYETRNAGKVVAAWGNHGNFISRSDKILKMIPNPYVFGKTKVGEPKHVLYLRNDSKISPLN
jgi:hypothetical protein